MRALVVGQGSIGQRHRRLLDELGLSVDVVSGHAAGAFAAIGEVPALASIDYAVLANPTAQHEASVRELVAAGFRGRLLIEKPVLAQEGSLPDLSACRRVAIGYNLRTHPVIRALAGEMAGRVAVAIRMHVGQHLADWRPGRDYRDTSSAKISQGGGALRDLSHELDLLLHLFGPWRRLVAAAPARQMLDIETDECWSIIVDLASGALLTLTLNYHDRPAERRYVVTTQTGTLVADLIGGTLETAQGRQHFSVARDQTYSDMHRMMLEDRADTLTTLGQAMQVLHLIQAIEQSAATGNWQDNV